MSKNEYEHIAVAAPGRTGRFVGQTLLNIAALGGLVCIVLVILAFAFNITLIMFKTGSMSPTIPAGSLAVVREIPASEIEVGDVLTVDRAGMLPVTHRVTSVSGEGASRSITMKGDANESEDPAPYTVTEARRVLVSVPELAKVVVWFSNPLVLGGITIAASVLVTWAFWPKQPRRGESRGKHGSSGEKRAEVAGALALLVAVSAVVTVAPAPAQAAVRPADTETTISRGQYITLTSIGDPVAMRSMVPGVAVPWQVGVQVDAPEPGTVNLSLEAEGSTDLGLSVDIRACSVRWVAGACGGDESNVSGQGPVDVGGGAMHLASMGDDEARWILVSATISEPNPGEVTLRLRADGTSDSASVSPGEVGAIARTGAEESPALWLGGAAVLVGLLAAGAARLVRRAQVPVQSQTGDAS